MTLPADWPGGFWLHFIVFTLIIIVFVFGMAMVFIYLERRGSGRFQSRLGPNRTGPFGVLQPVADAIKALTKETITPSRSDKWVYWLAPVVAFTPVMMVFAVIPLQSGAVLADLNIGILYVVAISSVSIVGIVMAGWGSNNKYSLIGAMRAVAQVVSYEIPMGLAIISVVLMAGSLSLSDIVNAQGIPFILLQPMGFLVFYLAASAEINRSPFDLLEAESEIVAGYNIEYSGMKFALFYLVEYCEALAVSAIITTLFLAGWRGPLLPPIIWFLGKLVAVFFLIVWVRSTLPRLRIDQVMGFAWKFLLPVALINMFITAVQVIYFPSLPWPIILVNLAVLGVLVILWSRLYRLGGGRVEV
ncbi:MAG: NADH-quinone oxidoreductase subunit NuoH [Chloroflexota bacterium]